MTTAKALPTMPAVRVPSLRSTCAALALTVFAVGCSTTKNQAPVEERTLGARTGATAAPPPAASPAPAAPAVDAAKIPPGQDNLGKPGYYQVKPGETLIRIALDNGQNWRDVARWNGLDNPNVIEVGQVLRVVPPGNDSGTATRPVGSARVEPRPLDAKAPAGTASAPAAPVGVAAAPAAPAGADEEVTWQWPASGGVLSGFDEGRTKGLAIAGKPGDPVLAAADGRVVYAGSGLRGYGNLVILKHNNTYLTAYAHNQVLLVKEDQTVRRGQKIAEMGSTDADRVQLHFEVRRQGKPIDPSKLLPPR
jgi:lipoprotein NlpD